MNTSERARERERAREQEQRRELWIPLGVLGTEEVTLSQCLAEKKAKAREV